MKKIFQFALMAALTAGLGMGVASCKDDDKNDSGDATAPSASAEEQADRTQKYWDVVSQLVGAAAITPDYEDKTFEPTIGEPETPGSLTRVVFVNDMKSASQRFANLVGASIDENTPSYNYDDPDVGTLTYTRMANAEALAVVDVDIKQVPHLKRIVYRALSDENKSFGDQKAYYRFGDIVKRVKQDVLDDEEYWICVRPAFTYEGKGDSHWISVKEVPLDNVKSIDYDDKTFSVPTKLGTDKVNMQNFAEMLWAICQPGKWYDVASNYHTDGRISFSGVPIFEDFQAKNLKYHNQYFWQNVQKGWKDIDKKDSLEEVLGLKWSQLQTMMGGADGNGRAYVHLLHKGYSWWTWLSSPNLTLYCANYTNGTGDKRNMHNAEYEDKKQDVSKFQNDFYCRRMPEDPDCYKEFWDFDNDYRFVIRHATGKDLNDGNTLDPMAALGPKYKEVYRYYAKYVNEYRRETDGVFKPEITQSSEGDIDFSFENRGFYDLGDVVEDGKGCRWFCVQPSAVGTMDHKDDEKYAYFVCLEKDAVGEQLQNIANYKNMAAQMIFDLAIMYQAYEKATPVQDIYKQVNNLMDNCDIDFNELFGVRDSTLVFRNPDHPDQAFVTCISTLYKNDTGGRNVLRILLDTTHKQADGGRDFLYQFWDSYSNSPDRIMTLDDLNELSVVKNHNEDYWVNFPWYDLKNDVRVYKNYGPRKEVEQLYPVSRFIYQKGRNAIDGTIPANMYREPIIPFAVKRVHDVGHASYSFEDGTAYTHVSLLQSKALIRYDQPPGSYGKIILNYYSYLQGGGIRLNNNPEPYDFKMNNKP